MHPVVRFLPIAFLACFLALPWIAFSQEKKEDAKEDPIKILRFQDTDRGLNICAMTACVGSVAGCQPQPWGLLATRMLASSETVPLPLWQFDFREVPPLDRRNLDRTVDGRRLPRILYEDVRKLGPDQGFYELLNQAVENAYRWDLDLFKNSAEPHEHVVFAHLKATPAKYRGKVITVKGKVGQIRKDDTPRLAANRLGPELPHIYYAWITGPKGSSPYAVLFTELPPEVTKADEKLDLDVTFHGYFLAMVAFPPDKEVKGKSKDIICPYLIGKTLIVHPSDEKRQDNKPQQPDEKDTTPTSAYIIAWTIGSFVVVALLVGVLNVWLRRGDRRTQSQLAEVRDRLHPFNVEPAEEPSPPLARPISPTDEIPSENPSDGPPKNET